MSHQGAVLHILETHTLHQALDLIKSIVDSNCGVWCIKMEFANDHEE